MKTIINTTIKYYLKNRYKRIETIKNNSINLQNKLLQLILLSSKGCSIYNKYLFDSVNEFQDFKSRVPIVHYNDIEDDIFEMTRGKANILCPGKTKYFAKSSGTTNSRSKYIPFPKNIKKYNHEASSWDLLSIIYNENADSKIFQKKSILMGGSTQRLNNAIVGDVSALLIKGMPYIGKMFLTPSIKIATMPNWEEKIELMAEEIVHQPLAMLGGVPTWTMLLCNLALQKTGKSNIFEIWPDLECYIHGGVGFQPYENQYKAIFNRSNFKYYEAYNASEGFFAISDRSNSDELLLLTDHGIFYEFMPLHEFQASGNNTHTLEDVQLEFPYVMIITTYGGLWRYVVGDIIKFTSLHPFRIKIEGRTQQYINVFGEEIMVADVEKALQMSNKIHYASIIDYTIGPQFMDIKTQGRHIWLIEFEKAPKDLSAYSTTLDQEMRNVNSDYDAKRSQDLVLMPLEIQQLAPKSFEKWMKFKGKFGGQNKVPRLSNTDTYIKEIINFINK